MKAKRNNIKEKGGRRGYELKGYEDRTNWFY